MCAGTVYGQDKTVAVLQPRILGSETVSSNNQLIVTASMKKAFTLIDGYKAYTRTDQSLIDAELAFQRSGKVEESQIKEAGKQTGVAYICVFTLSMENNELVVNSDIINVETAEIENSDYIVLFDANDRERVAKQCQELAYSLLGVTMNMQQLERVLTTARQLETIGEKNKARKQYEDAMPLLVEVEQVLNALLTPTMQHKKASQYRSEIIQALARLAQGVYVYVEGKEELVGTKVNIVINKVKAELAENGCSFTEDEKKADFKLTINVSTRLIGKQGSVVFCAADAQVELYDTHKRKTVYNNEITQKGSSVSEEKAGRIALNNLVPDITEKLMTWVKN